MRGEAKFHNININLKHKKHSYIIDNRCFIFRLLDFFTLLFYCVSKKGIPLAEFKLSFLKKEVNKCLL